MNMASTCKPVVLVPVHRPQPTPDEQFSLKRCGQLLGSHPIRIVHPDGLNLEAYRDLLPTAKPFSVPVAWMASIQAYNRMMINPAFYSQFDQFSHVLVHEPDALVISDQLIYWCEQPFDYIGAPWFLGTSAAAQDAPIIGVGNSGFSLIKIMAIRRLLESKHRWISRSLIAKELLRKFRRLPSRYSFAYLFGVLGYSGLLRGAHRVLDMHWDIFLSFHASSCFPLEFKIADPHSAMHFSWEVNPVRCAELCSNCPPFGIHAWARYNRAFVLNLLNYSLEPAS
jgi:hypothetical protein